LLIISLHALFKDSGKILFSSLFNSLNVIIRLMLSVWHWPKVIKLSGFYCIIIIIILFFLDFGLSQLTSFQFIQYHVAGFYKQTIPQSPPSHLQDYSTCNNARLEFSTIFVPSFDPNEWCLKNGLHSGFEVWTQDLWVMSLLP